MGVITYDMELASPIPPAKLFKAFVLDADTLIPKIMPQAIKSVEILEGDGGPGTIKLTTFGEGSQFKSVKQRIDGIDKENFTYNYSIIEGDALQDAIESISYEVQILPGADGGSICKNSSKYTTKGDTQITEEQIKAGKEKASAMFKAIESYLLANPDA
ncbi:major strawberry allergen Fra a 1-2-like [Diospyros lotus]|uniref:major strawberry allergen Fra a 1-2-like n=1 Tax=Diospyros lotus TaxID=55363 RepID=UPI00225C0A67|nr:major strawberry allergen Fra a 1-2-like [Diospyros lotus]